MMMKLFWCCFVVAWLHLSRAQPDVFVREKVDHDSKNEQQHPLLHAEAGNEIVSIAVTEESLPLLSTPQEEEGVNSNFLIPWYRECGTRIPSEEELRMEYRLHRTESLVGPAVHGAQTGFWMRLYCRLFPTSLFCTTSLLPTVTISVYWHIIAPNETTINTMVNDTMIAFMTDRINQQYQTTGFSFVYQNTSRTARLDWYDAPVNSNLEQNLMTALRVGGNHQFHLLNIYIKNANLDNAMVCGYTRLAQDAAAVGILDGVVVHPICLGPGDGLRNGDTLPHEIGTRFDLI